MRVIWYLWDLNAAGPLRGEAVARWMNRETAGTQMVCKGEAVHADLHWADVMVFQRQESEGMLEYMRAARERGVKVIWETDDDLWHLPPNLRGPKWRPETPGLLDRFVRAADAVTVSTEGLARVALGRVPEARVRVIPNGLNWEEWALAHARRAARPRNGHVTIGFMGSKSHVPDAAMVMPALRNLMARRPEVRLHCIGWIHEFLPGMDPARVKAEGWVSLEGLPEAMSDFDVGLAPLVPEKFNAGKSGIKALQYWALGIPVVATAAPQFREIVEQGRDGFLIDHGEDWDGPLERLIADERLRESMGALGRLKVLGPYGIAETAQAWMRLFGDLMQEGRGR
jgi:glycosyltransferase involved in cell wall biosynthesis